MKDELIENEISLGDGKRQEFHGYHALLSIATARVQSRIPQCLALYQSPSGIGVFYFGIGFFRWRWRQ